jgi:hypothetical protein
MILKISVKPLKLSILSGIIGQIIYFPLMILLGFFEPIYNHSILLIYFTIGLHNTIPNIFGRLNKKSMSEG